MAHDERALTRADRGGAIATEAPSNPWGSVGLLKPYAGGLVESRPRVDALATISAGYRNQDGRPVVSRDGTIHIAPPAGQAPGLEAALAATGNKSLTIALAHNDPREILQQRFSRYSATRVEAHGDAESITVIHLRDTGRKDNRQKPVYEPERETVRHDENAERFALLAAEMKVQTSMYFALAYWTDDNPPRPRLYFPDGLGLYRLRFTSLNSAEAIRGALYHVASLNGGVVAGVPLELAIVYQDVAGPDGSRRNVPIWSLRLRPPETIQLEPDSVRAILSAGSEQARMLSIAAPRPETLELAEYEGPDVDLDEARVVNGEIVTREVTQRDARILSDGGRIANPERFVTEFMIHHKSTSLNDKATRQRFMLRATGGRTDSLRTFAETSSHAEANRLWKLAAEWLNRERSEAPMPAPREAAERPRGRSYDELFPPDDDEVRPAEKRAPERVTMPPEAHAAAQLTGAPVARFDLPPEPDWGSWEAEEPKRPVVLKAWSAWTEAALKIDPRSSFPEPETLATPLLITALGGIVQAVERVHHQRFGESEDVTAGIVQPAF